MSNIKIDVKKIRKSLGFSQQQLADKIGVHLKTIQNYENGGIVPKSKHAILLDLSNKIQHAGIIDKKTDTQQNVPFFLYEKLLAENARLNNRIGELESEIKRLDAERSGNRAMGKGKIVRKMESVA